jgi:hypothetical protein
MQSLGSEGLADCSGGSHCSFTAGAGAQIYCRDGSDCQVTCTGACTVSCDATSTCSCSGDGCMLLR